MRRIGAAATLFVALASGVACGRSASGATGGYSFTAGLGGPVDGSIRFVDSKGAPHQTRSKSLHYRIELPPGRYIAQGQNAQISNTGVSACPKIAVVVRSHAFTKLDLHCD